MGREIKFKARIWKNESKFVLKMETISLCEFFENVGEYVKNDWNVELIQFTGTSDKNGQEIWEGDILKTRFLGGDYTIMEVFWSDNYSAWHLRRPDHEWALGRADNAKVIGTVSENPELLK